LEAWQGADFAAAVSAFERVIAKHASDGTAQRYLSRAQEQVTAGADPNLAICLLHSIRTIHR